MASFEKIAEGIYILKIPFGPVWTGVVLVRGDVTCLIDSGATAQDVDAYILPALKQMDLDLHDIDWLGNTHCHGDHIGGHRRLWELGKVPVAAFALAAPKVSDPVHQNPHPVPGIQPRAAKPVAGCSGDEGFGGRRNAGGQITADPHPRP